MKHKHLREEFSRLQTEAIAVVDLAAGENRELKPDEKTANDARFSKMEQIKAILDEDARFAKLALEGDDSKGTVTTPTNPPGKAEADAANAGHQFAAGDKIDRAEFSKALGRWASTGEMEKKFATITTATASGALLPKTIGTPLVPSHTNVFREGMSLYGLMPVETDGAEALTLPVFDASSGGEVAQDASSETTNDPSLSESIVLNPKTYQSGSAWFSNQQLAAAGFDLVTYIQQDLTYAKEQGFENAIVAAIIADAGITQTVTAATATTFTYANLVSLNRKLPKRYDRLKIILLGAAAYAYAEGLTDTTNKPVLCPDPQNQQLLRFNGTPVLRCDAFGAMTTGLTVGAVVSLLGFRIRDVRQQNLARYTQVPSKPNQTGFNLFSYGCHGYSPSAMAKFKMA